MVTAPTESGCANSFLVSLDAEAHRELIGISTLQKYAKGDSIFVGDDDADSVFIIARGRIKIYSLAEEGKELILWFFRAGDLFGIADAIGHKRGACARACVPADILQISRDQFRDFLVRHPAISLTVIDLLGRRLRTLGDVVQNLASTCVTGRVVGLLQRLHAGEESSATCPSQFVLPLTHQDIADMIGCCRQSVTETLGVLKRAGAIVCERQRVRVVNVAALAAAIPHNH